MMIGNRYKYMDSLRAALIIGGIFYHAALAYITASHWIVEDPSGMRVFRYLSGAIQTFRMPAFFFVAGFFCALSFAQRDLQSALRRRLLAFGIPLLCISVLVQPLQYMLELVEHDKEIPAPVEFLYAFYADGKFVSHLWFLVNLIVYYAVCWLFLTMLGSSARDTEGRKPGLLVSTLQSDWLQSKFLLAALSCVFTLTINFVVNRVDHVPGLVLGDLALYFPFFLAGYAAFVSDEFLDRVVSLQWFDWAVVAALFVFHAVVGVHNHKLASMFDLLFWYCRAWIAAMFVVFLARRYLDIQSALLRRVSEASYSIYLLHHIVVGALVAALIGAAVPGGYLTKYALVVCGTVAITYALHHRLIARFGLLRAMFNGNLDAFRRTKSAANLERPSIRPST